MNKEQTSVWDFINRQIDLNKNKRVNWRALFGFTLTEYIFNVSNNYGLNAENTYLYIAGDLKRLNLDTTENLRRVKISVFARIGEQKAYNNRKKNVKGEFKNE